MQLWSLVIHFAFAALVVGGMLGLSHVLGERHRDQDTDVPYESGLAPVGPVRGRFPVQFYLVAIAFLIFDLEVVYLVAWALVARTVGWTAFAAMAAFTVILLVGLLYEWRTGVLDWGREASPVGGRVPARAPSTREAAP